MAGAIGREGSFETPEEIQMAHEYNQLLSQARDLPEPESLININVTEALAEAVQWMRDEVRGSQPPETT